MGKGQHAAQRNIQATFYSDGTNVTGTTAATGGGAASQNRGASYQKANIVVMKGSGPPQPPQHSRLLLDAQMKAEAPDGAESNTGASGKPDGTNSHF